MSSTVKSGRRVGIDERREALRLRVMAGELAVTAGRRMRARREELKLTQPQVAAQIKKLLPEMAVDKQRVSDWERGYNFPSDRYKRSIAVVLQVEDLGGFSYFLVSDELEEQETPDPFAANRRQTDDRLEAIEQKLDQVLANQAKFEQDIIDFSDRIAAMLARSLVVATSGEEIDALRRQLGGGPQ